MVSTHLLGSNAFSFLRLLFIATLPCIPWYATLGCFTAWWCPEFQEREDENRKASDPGSRTHTRSSSPLSILWSKSQDQPRLKRMEKSVPSAVVGVAMSHWHRETWFIGGHYPNDLPQEIILELSVTQDRRHLSRRQHPPNPSSLGSEGIYILGTAPRWLQGLLLLLSWDSQICSWISRGSCRAWPINGIQ